MSADKELLERYVELYNAGDLDARSTRVTSSSKASCSELTSTS
jgi:hypothetical protein